MSLFLMKGKIYQSTPVYNGHITIYAHVKATEQAKLLV